MSTLASTISPSSLNASLYIVSGKGGVGKSTVAAALAAEIAKTGKKTLLAEIGSYSAYEFILGPELISQPIGYDPVSIPALGFDLALMSGDRCLKEYVTHLIKLGKVAELFFETQAMRALIDLAPGLLEIAILGKLTSHLRHVGPEFPYDVIVVDAHATGHLLSLLRAPVGLSKAIPFGPMGHHSRDILKILTSEKVKYILVSLPEDLPVTEVQELDQKLQAEFGIKSTMVMNQLHEAVKSINLSEISGDLLELIATERKLTQQLQPQIKIGKSFTADSRKTVDFAREALRAHF